MVYLVCTLLLFFLLIVSLVLFVKGDIENIMKLSLFAGVSKTFR